MKNLAKAGDILFYRVNPSSLKDRLIGLFQKWSGEGPGNYCHVSLLDSTLDFQHEAVIPRTRRSVVDWNNPHIEIWRIKDVTPSQVAEMLGWCEKHVGQWYALGKSLKCLLSKGRIQVCSEHLISGAYFAGVGLGDLDDPFVSPDELAECPLLYRVK